jgi:hypothetical protein
MQASRLAASRAGAPKPRLVAYAFGAKGLLEGPAAHLAAWPQATHRAHRCWQASHHGRPVATEIQHGAVRAQIEHCAVVHGRQFSQRGPPSVRTLTGRRRRHSTQISWLIGSRIRQEPQMGSPCSSRVAGSRAAPQRAHDWARNLAVQLRHNHFPPIGRCSRITRAQPGQGGRTIVRDPASQSTSINRSTGGTDACAPAPVSRSGRSCNAQARRCRCPTCGAAAAAAAAITSSGSVWSARATTSTISGVGSRPSSRGHCEHLGAPSRSRQLTRRSCPQAAQ